MRLPPMASSIAECAVAAEEAGADAPCIANSLAVLALDPPDRSPLLGNMIGGLSGSMVRPIILRLVWLASQATSIPIVACGVSGPQTMPSNICQSGRPRSKWEQQTSRAHWRWWRSYANSTADAWKLVRQPSRSS
ncbi:MAG: hypothetical protein ACYDDU_06450 [Dermatophilaceae bacterium]